MEWITQVLGANAPTENKELVDYLTSKNYATPADAIRGGYESHKLNVRKTDEVRAAVERDFVPAEDWKDEQWKRLTDRLRPKDKAGYKIEIPEALKGLVKPEKVQAMIDRFHADGLPPRLVNGFVKDYIDGIGAEHAALVAEAERIKGEDEKLLNESTVTVGTGATARQVKWADQKILFEEQARRGMAFAAKAAGLEEKAFGQLLEGYGVDSHPAFKRLFRYIGELAGDPKFVAGNADSNRPASKSTGTMMVEAARNPSAAGV
jgi:hypothetical protein